MVRDVSETLKELRGGDGWREGGGRVNDDLSPIYYRVSPALWRQRAWTDDMRLLACYMLTCPHRSLEGLFILPLGYVCGDLRWPAERLPEPFAALVTDSFLGYDDEAEVCLIVKALKYQRPENPNMELSAARRIMAVPTTDLDESFFASAAHYAPRFAKRLGELLPERFGKSQLYSALLNSALLLKRADARETSSAGPRVGAKSQDNGNGSDPVCWRCGESVAEAMCDGEAVLSPKGLRHKTCPVTISPEKDTP